MASSEFGHEALMESVLFTCIDARHMIALIVKDARMKLTDGHVEAMRFERAIEQKFYPIDDAKYGCYMDTQRRVAHWVEQTNHSQSQSTVEGKRSKSRRSSSSRSRSHKRSRHHESVGFAPPVPKLPFSPGSSVRFPGDIGVSPAIALLSSSLLVFAILPSLIAISVFAAALTYASVESERPNKIKSEESGG